jgi:superfamily II DNA or RNA helicase
MDAFLKRIRIEERPDDAAGAGEKPAKKPKIYHRKSRWDDPAFEAELKAMEVDLSKCRIDEAYVIPRNAMHITQYNKLKRILTTDPKPRYNPETKQLVKNPWPMYREVGAQLYIPRVFGLRAFGKPDNIKISNTTMPDFPASRLSLIDAERAKREFRVDQVEAVGTMLETYDKMKEDYGFCSGVFTIRTGGGKTACAFTIAAHFKMRTLVAVPSAKLFPQFKEDCRKVLGDSVRIGELRTSEKRNWKGLEDDPHIVLTTYVSLATIDFEEALAKIHAKKPGYDGTCARISSYGLVIVDEAHKTLTPQSAMMYTKFHGNVLALTATPERSSDECGIYAEDLVGPVGFYERMDVADTRWGGAEIEIVPLALPKPINDAPVGGKRRMEGIYQQIIHSKLRNKWLVGEWARCVREEKRHIVCLYLRTKHMEIMRDMLKAAGLQVGVIHGKATPEEIEEAYRSRIILAEISMGAQALNVPRLDMLTMLSGGSWNDETFWTQAIGRIFRDIGDKSKLKPKIVLYSDVSVDGFLDRQVHRAVDRIRKLSAKDGFNVTTLPRVDLGG